MLPIALVTGMALALVPAGAARGGRAVTGFERRGGTSWTTPEEEHDYLREVAAGPGVGRPGWGAVEVALTRIGTSARGRPLELVALTAAGAPPGPIRVLFVCGQHGDEPAGREAGLKLIRDLATDRSATGRRLLERVTVLVVPSANPDALVAGTRETADGVDLNRDHLALATPEARAIRQVLREWRPHVVHDLHEFDAAEGTYTAPVLYLWPRNLNVSPELRGLARELARDRIGPAVRAAGWNAGVYGEAADGRRVAGDADERTLRNVAGIGGAVSVLVEVRSVPTSGLEASDAGLLGRRRVAAHLVAARATLRMVVERGDAITSAVDAARTGPAQWVHFDGADDAPAERVAPVARPCGYRLTEQVYESVGATLAAHGIEFSRDLRVPTGQEAGALVPLLLDPRARYVVGVGEPEGCAGAG
jgi:predicted deacylase